MTAFLAPFQERSFKEACRRSDALKEKKKVETYNGEIMNKIRNAVNTSLLTDLLHKDGVGKADTWHVTIKLDPKFYADVENDVINSLKRMGLKADVDHTEAFNNNCFKVTIQIDDEIESDEKSSETLQNRGWDWKLLEKSSLQQRIQQAIKMQHARLSREIYDCMKEDFSKYNWTFSPRNPVSQRVLERVQQEVDDCKYNIVPRFEEGKLMLDITDTKKV